MNIVSERDIFNAFRELGVTDTDTLLVHSSLKSFGRVEGENAQGAANTVINALSKVVENGTLVFPSLRQREFYNAYRDWDIASTPSDVGLISETFRKSEGVLRSDQATHSVCARGIRAKYITEGHSGGRARVGVFGDTPFSHSSPWQKMYDLNAKVAMVGVSMVYNTFKHFVEYKLADDILSSISDPLRRTEAATKLSRFAQMEAFSRDPRGGSPDGVWFWHDGLKAQNEMVLSGRLREVMCGESTIILFGAADFVDFMYAELLDRPEKWLNDGAVAWINAYKE